MLKLFQKKVLSIYNLYINSHFWNFKSSIPMPSWTAPAVDRLPGVCRWVERFYFFEIMFACRFILRNVNFKPLEPAWVTSLMWDFLASICMRSLMRAIYCWSLKTLEKFSSDEECELRVWLSNRGKSSVTRNYVHERRSVTHIGMYMSSSFLGLDVFCSLFWLTQSINNEWAIIDVNDETHTYSMMSEWRV